MDAVGTLQQSQNETFKRLNKHYYYYDLVTECPKRGRGYRMNRVLQFMASRL